MVKNPSISFIFSCIISWLIWSPSAVAQNATFKKSKVELRMGAGASMFFGDLGGNFKSRKDGFLDIDMRSVRGNFNLSAKYNIYKWLAIRTDFNQAQVVGDDAFSAEYFRRNRNLSFSSSISELSLTGELVAVNLLRWRQLSKLHFELYGFGGLLEILCVECCELLFII